ncbi:MAG: hypothetical protein H0W40_10740 [Methylibium sp.]|uniref:hypothetical protein n=1 Tax=Methylibium sp. TaxID=2067992 RepID=UPI00185EDBFE|nr:hypothetical protein [Methylibium sp.]MBA3597836.1 hypothetical protein [Methylibium sp.]
MKTTILMAALCAFVSLGAHAKGKGGSQRVFGYITKSGMYVIPHRATNFNSTKPDNYSTKGNVNPYTGKVGTKGPVRIQAAEVKPK